MATKTRRMGLGEYSGRCMARVRAHGLLFTENRFPPGRQIDHHSHVFPHFTLLLEGGFVETHGDRRLECDKGSLLVVPSYQAHTDTIGPGGAHSLSIELSTRLTTRISRESTLLKRAEVLSSPVAFSIGKRIYGEFARGAGASGLALESLSLQLIVTAIKCFEDRITLPVKGPEWMVEVIEDLDRNFRETIHVGDLARKAGVHQAHLMRAFKRSMGCTVGEYLRKLRLQSAMLRLSSSEDSIAQIAGDSGFCDQAHFCRAFKAAHGLTPSAFRARR